MKISESTSMYLSYIPRMTPENVSILASLVMRMGSLKHWFVHFTHFNSLGTRCLWKDWLDFASREKSSIVFGSSLGSFLCAIMDNFFDFCVRWWIALVITFSFRRFRRDLLHTFHLLEQLFVMVKEVPLWNSLVNARFSWHWARAVPRVFLDIIWDHYSAKSTVIWAFFFKHRHV